MTDEAYTSVLVEHLENRVARDAVLLAHLEAQVIALQRHIAGLESEEPDTQ